ncbi:MAG: PfkB family carbohydrate kinase, partial [Planctomycetota bacterium]
RLKRELELSHLLVTRDRHGGVRYDTDDYPHTFASAATCVIDEVGAGDALLAATTLALAGGLAPRDATQLGQWAAAAALARMGNAPVGWPAVGRAATRALSPAKKSARPAA